MAYNRIPLSAGARLLSCIAEEVAKDPVAQVNLSALIRAVTDRFIAMQCPIETTRVLGIRFESKTADLKTNFRLPPETKGHYTSYAAGQGHTFASLIVSALALHYLGPTPAPKPIAPIPPVRNGKVHRVGWRTFILSLDIGQRHDLPVGERDPVTVRRAIHNTAEIMRNDSLPGLRITTKVTPTFVCVTRVA